jgi:hypothetical protein
LAAALLTGAASADIPIGEGSLALDLSDSIAYDSNVFGIPNGPGAFSDTLTPHAKFVRQAGEVEASSNASISFVHYFEQTQLNTNQVNFDTTLKIAPDTARKFSGTLMGSYLESSQLNTDVDARINSKTATFTDTSALITGPRTDLAFSGSYTDVTRSLASDQQLLDAQLQFDYKDFLVGNTVFVVTNYDRAQSSGQNVLGADLNQNSYAAALGLSRGFYHDAIQASLSYGYRVLYRAASETATGDTRQYSPVVAANLSGPFLPAKYFPKVRSQISLGYEEATTPGVDDPGDRALTGSLTAEWQARDTTVASFSATRSQRLSAQDLTVVSSDVLLSVEQTLRYNLTGTLSAGYDWDNFRGINRADRTVLANAGMKYVFARTWNAIFSYRFSDVESTLTSATYNRHVVSLAALHQF